MPKNDIINGNNSHEHLLDAVVKVFQQWDKCDRGWYYGFSMLIDELHDATGEIPNEKEVRKILRSLVKDKVLRCQWVCNRDDSRLNGKGYFYNRNMKGRV